MRLHPFSRPPRAQRPLDAALAAGASACLALGCSGCGGGGGGSRADARPESAAQPGRLGKLTLTDGPSAAPTSRTASSTGARSRPPERAPGLPAVSGPARPAIAQDPIPFGARRRAEMAAYALRHYGLHTYRLIHPHVIVIHYTETPDFAITYNAFAPDVPDSELHELPNTCAHFVIDRGGTIHQLVSLALMCRHTVGLNWTAIGIEHVGFSDAQVLSDRAQMHSSLRLVRWLRCRYGIALANVIGHNESLSSPFHRERVAALRKQTHGDFVHADIRAYRRRLRALGGCG
jgi:N-acetylmuramoyl-L-alanine amidase